MLQEEYVTFETAKLLKKAGFPQWVMTPTGERDGVPCVKCYRKDGLLTDWIFMRGHKSAFSAPTQSQAMRWLRDRERIIVSPDYRWDGAWGCVLKSQRFNIYKCYPKDYDEYFPTYEAAAEAGIQAACEHLIEKGGGK